MSKDKILVVTLPPYQGGVPAKTRILCNYLERLGHKITVAWYATFAHHPGLNVPSWRLWTGSQPKTAFEKAFDRYDGVAVGCRFPELETPYYQVSPLWRDLIAAHDRVIAVGGPPMVGHIPAQIGIPFFLWCACDVMTDRADRQKTMPLARAVVDRLWTRPVLMRQQRFLLDGAALTLGVSNYTLERLLAVGAPAERLDRLPIPVDPKRFTPAAAPGRDVIGFAARFEDPRKNLNLLLHAFVLLKKSRPKARLRLAGTEASAATLAQMGKLGLSDSVDLVGEVSSNDLPDFYRSLDVFVIPSAQEGLCISGIEALASGVPVVSTPCGGPMDYVRSDETGFVAGWEPESLADKIALALDRRAQLSPQAREAAVTDYSPAAFERGIDRACERVWGGKP